MDQAIKEEHIPSGGIADFIYTDEELDILEQQELEADYGKSGIAQFKKVGKKIIKTGGGIALGIKDVSGKDDKGVLKTVSNKKSTNMSDELKKRYVVALRNTFKEFTSDMTSLEKNDLLKQFARDAGIEDVENFKISVNTNPSDLVFFSEQLIEGKPKDIVKKKKTIGLLNTLDSAKKLSEINNQSVE